MLTRRSALLGTAAVATCAAAIGVAEYRDWSASDGNDSPLLALYREWDDTWNYQAGLCDSDEDIDDDQVDELSLRALARKYGTTAPTVRRALVAEGALTLTRRQ